MKYIETKKGKLPVNYGMFALSQFSAKVGLSMDDVFAMDITKMSLMDVMEFVYTGIKDGARKAGEDCAFKSVEEFLDYADTDPKVIEKVLTVFSNYNKVDEDEEGDKKK